VKFLGTIGTIVSMIIGVLMYVIRQEIHVEVGLLRERVIAIETIVPEMGENIREVKEDVKFIRRNFMIKHQGTRYYDSREQ